MQKKVFRLFLHFTIYAAVFRGGKRGEHMGKQKAITMQDRKILAERWANGENATVIAVDLGFSAAAI